MGLIEVVAEYLYLLDTDGKPEIPFPEQDSNVRDFYLKEAREQISNDKQGNTTRIQS